MGFFFLLFGSQLDLHVLRHSFPTRRSSDLFDQFEMSLIAQLLGFPHERALVDSLANAIVSRFTYLGCDVEHDLLATVLLATINADACHEGNLLRSHPEPLFETARGYPATEHGDIAELIPEAL